jgi:hypothetical protein
LEEYSIEYKQFRFGITAIEPIILPVYRGSTPHPLVIEHLRRKREEALSLDLALGNISIMERL